ncbi:hypothetical protein C6502_01815 [Candidatus Poribacteria bacterium]|nr:MAG: hypothetical protein C6502_01815 [Candidatus Poribacteria bacterium]
MDMGATADLAFLGLVISLVFYIVLFWVLIRFIRAVEKIADNFWSIARAHTRSVDAIEKVANRIERIADNENTR